MVVLARVAFVALILSALSAFFISQRIKSAPAVVDIRELPAEEFSPRAKWGRSVARFAFRLKRVDDATVSITSADGDPVRRLATDQPMQPYRSLVLKWNGRKDDGKVASNGKYWVRISLRHQGRSLVMPRAINLNSTRPSPEVVSVRPDVIGSGSEKVEVRVKGINRDKETIFRVVRTDVKPMREVAQFKAPAGASKATWNGRMGDRSIQQGTYMIVPQVEDRAGNIGSTPAHIPPLPGEMKGHGGLTVRRLAIQPPLAPVVAGNQADFFVDSRGKRYRWSIRRVGQPRILSRGSNARPGRPLRVSTPSGDSGVYLLEVSVGSDRANVPFMVQSKERSRLLVVLPVITWVGTDNVDDRPRDGLPNLLSAGESAQYRRVLVGEPDSGLPVGFRDEIAPLLMFLDHQHISYDLTSDLALAIQGDQRGKANGAGSGASTQGSKEVGFDGHRGVLLAGQFRWTTSKFALNLRNYTQSGGRVAFFGAGTLRSGVTVADGKLGRPTAESATDIFGFELAQPRKSKAKLVTLQDSSKFPLLTGTDGVLHGFKLVEESLKSPGKHPAAALGEAPTSEQADRSPSELQAKPVPLARPALEAVGRGKGYVIRVGLPEWPQRIRRDPKVAQITHNVFDLLRGEQPSVRVKI